MIRASGQSACAGLIERRGTDRIDSRAARSQLSGIEVRIRNVHQYIGKSVFDLVLCCRITSLVPTGSSCLICNRLFCGRCALVRCLFDDLVRYGLFGHFGHGCLFDDLVRYGLLSHGGLFDGLVRSGFLSHGGLFDDLVRYRLPGLSGHGYLFDGLIRSGLPDFFGLRRLFEGLVRSGFPGHGCLFDCLVRSGFPGLFGRRILFDCLVRSGFPGLFGRRGLFDRLVRSGFPGLFGRRGLFEGLVRPCLFCCGHLRDCLIGARPFCCGHLFKGPVLSSLFGETSRLFRSLPELLIISLIRVGREDLLSILRIHRFRIYRFFCILLHNCTGIHQYGRLSSQTGNRDETHDQSER